MLKVVLFLSVLFCAFGCNSQKQPPSPLSIMQFYPFPDIVRTDSLKVKEDYFLVEDLKDNSKIEPQIDSFVQVKWASEKYNNWNIYRIYFYNKSEYTNVEKIKENPRNLIRYSNDHDLIYEYDWNNGKFEARYKFKNGDIIEPSSKGLKFTIKNLPNK